MIDCAALLKHLSEIMVATVILALAAGIHYLIERVFLQKRNAKRNNKLH